MEPLAVDDSLRKYLRVDHTIDDDTIGFLITEAREDAELYAERQLITATYTLTLDSFPLGGGIIMPRPNLLSVVSITYVDADGTTTELSTDDYAVDTETEPGWVLPSLDAGDWPTTRDQTNAVQVTFTCGYGPTREDVPQGLRALMRAQVALKYDNRPGHGPALEQIHKGYRKYWHGLLTVQT